MSIVIHPFDYILFIFIYYKHNKLNNYNNIDIIKYFYSY